MSTKKVNRLEDVDVDPSSAVASTGRGSPASADGKTEGKTDGKTDKQATAAPSTGRFVPTEVPHCYVACGIYADVHVS